MLWQTLPLKIPIVCSPAAKHLHLTIKTTPLVTRILTKTGITANANVIATAFSDDVLEQGNNSKVLTLKDGALLVLRVNKHIAAAVEPLTAVEMKIKQQLLQQQAEKKAVQLGNTLLPKITTNAAAKRLATQYGLYWLTQSNVSRETKLADPLILQQAFNMPSPSSQNAFTVKGLALANGNYALVAVMQTTNADVKFITATQRALLAQQLENVMAQASYDAYVKTQVANATVKHYLENLAVS